MHTPLERLAQGHIPRHQHREAYAALVVSGRYEESGSTGRFRVSAGDVLVHRCFEAHMNMITSPTAMVVNLALGNADGLPSAFTAGKLGDALLQGDVAALQQERSFILDNAIAPLDRDWPDQLASAILACPTLRIAEWAAVNRLAAATVSRGFRCAFGVSPARFRTEARARAAVSAIRSSAHPLAQIACELGFADQAHMSRDVQMLSGYSPGTWLRVKFVQDRQVRGG